MPFVSRVVVGLVLVGFVAVGESDEQSAIAALERLRKRIAG
jgi:hypothetical protein